MRTTLSWGMESNSQSSRACSRPRPRVRAQVLPAGTAAAAGSQTMWPSRNDLPGLVFRYGGTHDSITPHASPRVEGWPTCPSSRYEGPCRKEKLIPWDIHQFQKAFFRAFMPLIHASFPLRRQAFISGVLEKGAGTGGSPFRPARKPRKDPERVQSTIQTHTHFAFSRCRTMIIQVHPLKATSIYRII